MGWSIECITPGCHGHVGFGFVGDGSTPAPITARYRLVLTSPTTSVTWGAATGWTTLGAWWAVTGGPTPGQTSVNGAEWDLTWEIVDVDAMIAADTAPGAGVDYAYFFWDPSVGSHWSFGSAYYSRDLVALAIQSYNAPAIDFPLATADLDTAEPKFYFAYPATPDIPDFHLLAPFLSGMENPFQTIDAPIAPDPPWSVTLGNAMYGGEPDSEWRFAFAPGDTGSYETFVDFSLALPTVLIGEMADPDVWPISNKWYNGTLTLRGNFVPPTGAVGWRLGRGGMDLNAGWVVVN